MTYGLFWNIVIMVIYDPFYDMEEIVMKKMKHLLLLICQLPLVHES